MRCRSPSKRMKPRCKTPCRRRTTGSTPGFETNKGITIRTCAPFMTAWPPFVEEEDSRLEALTQTPPRNGRGKYLREVLTNRQEAGYRLGARRRNMSVRRERDGQENLAGVNRDITTTPPLMKFLPHHWRMNKGSTSVVFIPSRQM